jgi:hypothetical protein
MVAALPYIAMAGGTLMQMNAAEDQANQRRGILNEQLSRDEAASKKGSELVLAEGANYDPAQRAHAMTDQENQKYDSSVADLKAGAAGGDPSAVSTSGDAGAVSDDFVKTKAARAISEGTRLTGIAHEIAKTQAPTLLLGIEGQRNANLASNLQDLYGSNTNMGAAAKTDAAGVQQPEYGGLGKIASTIGSSYIAGDIAKQNGFLDGLNGAGGPFAKAGARGAALTSNAGSGINWERG